MFLSSWWFQSLCNIFIVLVSDFFLSNFGLPQSFGGLVALHTFVLLPMIMDQVWASCNLSFLPVQLSLIFFFFFWNTLYSSALFLYSWTFFFFLLLPGPYTNGLKCSLSVSKIDLLKHSLCQRVAGSIKTAFGQPFALRFGCVQTSWMLWVEKPFAKHKYEH